MRIFKFAAALCAAQMIAGCAVVSTVGAVGSVGASAVSTTASIAATGANATLSGASAIVRAAAPASTSDEAPAE